MYLSVYFFQKFIVGDKTKEMYIKHCQYGFSHPQNTKKSIFYICYTPANTNFSTFMEIIKDETQPEKQINYIPGKIVFTKKEASKYVKKGGEICAFQDTNHLTIYIKSLTRFIRHKNRNTRNAKIEIIYSPTEQVPLQKDKDNLRPLPKVLKTDAETAKDSCVFHTFEFHGYEIILPQNRDTNQCGQPFLITENSPRTNLQ